MLSPKTIARAEWLHWPQTQQLVAAFASADAPLRFVGGAVRDALLGREVQDVDAATPLPPQKVMAVLEQAGIRSLPTGLSHGTITALIEGKAFEITTLRKDIKTFGRQAEVWFTDSWEEDAARRDFTMNALYADPDGAVHDPLGVGVEDALAGRVRFIGDPVQRIQEDGLRILRFFRFHASHGEGEPDAAAIAACMAEREKLKKLSGERITQEMLKLFAAEGAAEMVDVMERSGVLAEIIPLPTHALRLQPLPRLRLMAEHENIDPLIVLAILLHGQQSLTLLLSRWRLSGKQAARLSFLVGELLLPPNLADAAQKQLLRRWGAEDYTALVLISWCISLHHQPHLAQHLAAAYRAMLALPSEWEVPIFPVTGADLLSMGVRPGPRVGRILAELEQQWEAKGYTPTLQELVESL